MDGLALYLNDPLGREMVLQAVAISSLIAAAAAALSCFLVLKGWALMGDAISHAILPGVVIAYIVGLPLAVGAFLAGMFCAVATGYVTENSRVKQDTVMGVVFSGMFGVGVVLYTKIETEVHLDHILFGDMLGVTWGAVINTAIISLGALGLILIKRRDLLLFSFDPQHGRAVGLKVDWLHYGLLAILSLVIVSALQAVGLILSIALVIAPGAIAHLLTDRFDRMLMTAIFVGIASSVIGVLFSFHINAAPAPTIVVVMMVFFILTFLFAPKYGIVFSKRARGDPTNS